MEISLGRAVCSASGNSALWPAFKVAAMAMASTNPVLRTVNLPVVAKERCSRHKLPFNPLLFVDYLLEVSMRFTRAAQHNSNNYLFGRDELVAAINQATGDCDKQINVWLPSTR
jgi:hypothetical protein